MNILHLSETPLSGAPFRLMQVQRNGGINARLISHRNSYDGRGLVVFPSDILLQSGRSNREKRAKPDFNRDEIYELFRNADILHFHNYYLDQFIFRLYPDLLKYIGRKLVVVQFHSPRLSLKDVEKTIRHKDVDRRFVVAQYQVRQFPEATPVFNCVPIHDDLHSPIYRDNRPPIVTYSPSNTHLRGWNDKGYAATMGALQRAKTRIQPLVITNTPHQECLFKKQKADIAIDEVVTGSYHLNTIEALAQGQVAICGLDRECEELLKEKTGSADIPIVRASPSTLSDVLDKLTQDQDLLKSMQESSRSFMERYWSTAFLNDMYTKAYDI